MDGDGGTESRVRSGPTKDPTVQYYPEPLVLLESHRRSYDHFRQTEGAPGRGEPFGMSRPPMEIDPAPGEVGSKPYHHAVGECRKREPQDLETPTDVWVPRLESRKRAPIPDLRGPGPDGRLPITNDTPDPKGWCRTHSVQKL